MHMKSNFMSFANMDLRLLRHAVTLGKTLNYTQAAQELGLTQSALSRSIQSLEQRAQARLFDRDRGGVAVTELGRSYLARASAILREAEELDRMIVRSASAEIGEVRFGMAPLAARALMPNILAATLSSRPNLRTHVAIDAADTLLRLIRSEEIEFCVCAEQHVYPEDMRGVAIGQFPMSLLVRAGHPLLLGAKPESGRYPLVVSSPFQPTGTIPEFFLPLFAAPPQIVIEDLGVLAQVAANSDAVWLTSSFAVEQEIRRGLLNELALPNGKRTLHFRMVMYSRARRSLSPGAVLFRGLFSEEMRRLNSAGSS
jgi:DNA-binding transcriptional LysR family regulator